MPTKIEWTDETWNPVTGCTKISAGCANCYAERMAQRLAGQYGYPEAPHHFDVTLHPDKLDVPLRWRKPRMVFVCSMGDLFHKNVPEDYIVSVFARMVAPTEHTFQVLTKRPERMRDFVTRRAPGITEWTNIWLGVSAENQATADERIPLLLQTPAAVRFVSFEPLLGEIDSSKWLRERGGGYFPIGLPRQQPRLPPNWHQPRLDWIIVGGESGPGARPMHPDWARSLRDQAQAAGVPFFFKQWGQFAPECHWRQFTMKQRNKKGAVYSFDDKQFPLNQRMYSVGKKAAGRLLDGHEWNEMPNTTNR